MLDPSAVLRSPSQISLVERDAPLPQLRRQRTPFPGSHSFQRCTRATAREETARGVFESGADPNQLIDFDTSPLELAASSGNIEFIRLLMKHKAEQLPDPKSSILNTPAYAPISKSS